MRLLGVFCLTVSLFPTSALADSVRVAESPLLDRMASQSFMSPFVPCAATTAPPSTERLLERAALFSSTALQGDAQPLHATAIEHSQAYRTRAHIHKIASFATLPLFGAEVALGQSIYNTATVSGGKRSAHIAVGTAIIGLFAANTITGAWNMFGEDRQEPKGRSLRLVHALLMMAADAGFVATAVTGPHSNRREALTIPTGEATHRAIVFSSIGIGTTGYLVMLIGNR
jgi:hypothetical protein